jgi:Fe-S-cluster containining protein
MQIDTQQNELIMQVAKLEQGDPLVSEAGLQRLEKHFERGLRFAHVMMSINQYEGREGTAYAQALAKVLVSKGLVEQEELDTMMAQVRQEIEAQPTPKVMLSKCDNKYQCQSTVILDCASRLHICKARCCTLDFYLSDQDLDEGIVHWEYGRPYWIRKETDGYCAHCEPGTWRCQIHSNRPYVCRIYDCHNDKRIWRDFEKMIPNMEDLTPGASSKG